MGTMVRYYQELVKASLSILLFVIVSQNIAVSRGTEYFVALDGGSSVKVIKNKGNATTLRLPEFAPDSVVSIIAVEVSGNLP